MRPSCDRDDCEHQRPRWERPVFEAGGSVVSIRSRRWHRRLPMPIWNPCQIATQNIDSERSSHEEGPYPEAPVTMHTSPVRPWIGFASAVTVPFGVVLVSSHYFSISDAHLPLRRCPVAECSMIQNLFGRQDVGLATIPVFHKYYPREHNRESGQLWTERGLHIV